MRVAVTETCDDEFGYLVFVALDDKAEFGKKTAPLGGGKGSHALISNKPKPRIDNPMMLFKFIPVPQSKLFQKCRIHYIQDNTGCND